MDIKAIKPTAEVTFDVEAPGGQVEPMRFTVSFLPLDSITDYFPRDEGGKLQPPKRFSTAVRDMLIDSVVGWDLTENGTALPCTDENKAKCLHVIFGLSAQKQDGEEIAGTALDRVLGRALFGFATDAGNFLKN